MTKNCLDLSGTWAAACMILGLAATPGCDRKPETASPPEVYVQTAHIQNVQVPLELPGRTQGCQDVEIRARAGGYLKNIHFREGGMVKRGDLLFTIESASLQAVVDQRKAEWVSAQAKCRLAAQDLARQQLLLEQKIISRQAFESAVCAAGTAQAAMDVAKAALDKALQDIAYTKITSPCDGLTDFARIKPGNLVGITDLTLLTTISNIDPIHVLVEMKESDYLKHRIFLCHKDKNTEVNPCCVGLILADDSVYPARGYFDAIQRAMDPRTGNIVLRAIFPNADCTLRPGQSVRVRFNGAPLENAVLVPSQAVHSTPSGHQLAVVRNGKAQMRSVKMGPCLAEGWVVDKGLAAGEAVVVKSAITLVSGIQVCAKPYHVEEIG